MQPSTNKRAKHYEELLTTTKKKKKKKTPLVWTHDKSQWPIKDRPLRYSSRWKKTGPAEKEMDGQHCRVDREELCHDPSPCPWPSKVQTGKSFATTQALAHDHQRYRQGRALPRPKPLPMTIKGTDREELCHDPSPCPWPSKVQTGKSFASTQAFAHDCQRWRQGRALPRPKPLPMTVRGGDREELCHDPSPCPWPSEAETGKSFATTQALANDRQRRRQGRALPRPKPLPMTVRGGDSWCSVHQCSAPTTPGSVKGLVMVIVINYCLLVRLLTLPAPYHHHNC